MVGLGLGSVGWELEVEGAVPAVGLDLALVEEVEDYVIWVLRMIPLSYRLNLQWVVVEELDGGHVLGSRRFGAHPREPDCEMTGFGWFVGSHYDVLRIGEPVLAGLEGYVGHRLEIVG